MEAEDQLTFLDFLHRFKMKDVKVVMRRVCGARVVDVHTRSAVEAYSRNVTPEQQVEIREALYTIRRQASQNGRAVPQAQITLSTTQSRTSSPIRDDNSANRTRHSPSPVAGQDIDMADPSNPSDVPHVGEDYMKVVDQDVVDRCVLEFIERTNNESLQHAVCISCSRSLLKSTMLAMMMSDIPNRTLLRPVTPHAAHDLTDGMLLASGVEAGDTVHLCQECHNRLKVGRRPKLSLANGMWIGSIPDELRALTLPERILISLAFPACYVVKLYPTGKRGAGWQNDRLNSGLRGNVSSYKLDQQQISGMVGLTTVPPPPSILSATLAITYVGSNNLPKRCLPGTFRVRRYRVARALQWLKAHNPLYANLEISEDNLQQLPINGVPPEIMETVRVSNDVDSLQREHDSYVPQYDEDEESMDVDGPESGGEGDLPPDEDEDMGTSAPAVIPLQGHGVIDVAGHDVPDGQLFAHALANTVGNARPQYAVRHGGFVTEYARRNPDTGSRFDGGADDPNHLLAAFPYLFPYGKGGFETDQAESVSYEAHARWALEYCDKRFRLDLLFVFQVFGVIQKRQVCRAATLQIKAMSPHVHEQLRSLTPEDLIKASEEEARKVPFSNPAIRALRNQMTAIRARVVGTDEARRSVRGKTWGTTAVCGNAALWATINPSDNHNPLAQVFAGEEIDLDAFCNTAGPDSQRRAVNVAQDPYAAARFFHFFIDLVLEVLLGIKGTKEGSRITRKEGLFGKVQAYIGTVEAQGRGTLHLHILIWLKDAPSPEVCKQALRDPSFRQRLAAFIRQNIVADIDNKQPNEVFLIKPDKEAGYSRPLDPRHDDIEAQRKERTKVFARTLQYHQCRDRVCRVVKKGRVVCKRGAPFTTARDAWVSETGQWGPKRLCGLLNAWQPTLLHILCCNHDLKLLTGGEATQNVTWYIANYHAKNQEHTYNRSALLAQRFAYHVLEEMKNPNPGVKMNQRMLQRCTNSLSRDREFSAPEVISYLMGWGDTFESHHYVVIRWDSAMRTLLTAYPGLKAQNALSFERHPVNRDEDEASEENRNERMTTLVEPEESYTLQFTDQGLSIRNQMREYKYRGHGLEHDNFLQVFLDTYDAPYKEVTHTQPGITLVTQGPGEPNANGRGPVGRRANERIPYAEGYGIAGKCRIRRTPGHETLPRFSGRWFPRNNHPATRELYCASMLLLLKPWRSLEDLKSATETFEQAFDQFMATATVRERAILENIQSFYDCADQANAEVGEERNNLTYAAPLEEDLRERLAIVRPQDHDPVAGLTEQDVANARLGKTAQREVDFVNEGMSVAYRAGMTEPIPYSLAQEPPPRHCTEQDVEKIVTWEKKLKAITREHGTAGLTASHIPNLVSQAMPSAILTAIPPPTVSLGDPTSSTTVTDVGPGQGEGATSGRVKLRDLLNPDQRRAHDIIAECMDNEAHGRLQPQLLMVVHGQGGTGKSMLIGAITETLRDRGILHRLGKTATSGVAASPIGGNTVHHYWGIPIYGLTRDWISKSSDDVKTRRIHNISTKWMILVDEMSMLTRPTLFNMSELAQTVRMEQGVPGANSLLPFGGMHIVLLGDFHQFPPVAESHALYCSRPSEDSERAAFGREVFKQFTTVVILREQKRSVDIGWTQILNRLRVGECTDEDLESIRTLLLGHARCDVPDFTDPEWKDVVLVTPRHSLRMEWNEMALRKHCEQGGHRRFCLVAEDLDRTTESPPTLDYRVAIAGLKAKKTGKLEEHVVVAKGMRAMVLTNIATEADVANGTRGTIEDIWLDPEEEAFGEPGVDPRIMNDGTYVLRHLPPLILFRPDEPTPFTFPGIPPGLLPITPVKAYFKVENGRGDARRIKRTQYALTGAYAFTDYKAQGQTIEKVIIDLANPVSGGALSPFSAYVALSRGRGRHSIRLLRDFKSELFTTHPSEELREEMERLEELDSITKAHRMNLP